MLDVALLMANASQLKAVLDQGPHASFYTLIVTLISISLCLQVTIGVLLIFIGEKSNSLASLFFIVIQQKCCYFLTSSTTFTCPLCFVPTSAMIHQCQVLWVLTNSPSSPLDFSRYRGNQAWLQVRVHSGSWESRKEGYSICLLRMCEGRPYVSACTSWREGKREKNVKKRAVCCHRGLKEVFRVSAFNW